MFHLFEKTPRKSVIGIDFGTAYIKIVELAMVNRTPTLVNYGVAELGFSEGKGVFQIQAPEEKIQAHLRALLRKMHIDAAAACVALPSFSGLITVIELPRMNAEELEGAIRFEAPKYIPLPLEEVVLSWEMLQPDPSSKDKMRVLLVAALDKDIARYESYLHGQELSLEFLELEIFSLVRATIDDKTKNWLVIDIGSRATNIILVERGLVTANRTVNLGGNEMTNALMEGMQVSWARAEQLKKGAADYFRQQGAGIVFPTVEMANYEAKRMLDLIKKQGGAISGVILSGGASKMKGLDQYVSNALQLPVTFADPWARVRYPKELRPALDKYGSSFAIAIGLALGGLNEK